MGGVLTKSKLVRVDSLLWVSRVATNCFIVSMSMESSVDSVLEAGARVGVGRCRQSHGGMEASVP